nr:MAG TPA: hypothetical protein [Bacteriophage sp.]
MEFFELICSMKMFTELIVDVIFYKGYRMNY